MLGFAKKQIIRNDDGVPYMIRRAINTRFGGVKLHHILRSDDDRDLHDHPWSFLSIVLKGGYWEHTPTDCPSRPLDGGPHLAYENEGDTQNGLIYCRFCGLVRTRWTRKRWHGPGSILWRPAPSIHRLELPAPTRSPFNAPEDNTAWTLVFTGPKRREWGFHTICGFIPWFKYTAAKEEGC
jgi:hypothetical protein